MQSKSTARLAWFTLVWSMLVILWGALVRATGSGAGCGSHWPLCNGEVVPMAPSLETTIEYVHRITSGGAMLLVLALLIVAFRAFPRGHRVRTAAWVAAGFILLEALVGAGLVKFEWVADDASVGRTVTIAVHLANTFFLLAALALAGWWASGGLPVRLKGQGIALWGLALGLAMVMVLGMTGAITALGDTLFPASSLAEGMRQDLDPNAHFLLQLRVWHPIIAIVTGFYLLFLAGLAGMMSSEKTVKRLAWALGGLFVLQLGAGLLNIVLLVPVWMQIVHLALADLVWVTLVLFSAANLAESTGETVEASQPASSIQPAAL